MQTVERVIRLRQGPPWGFRLMDSYDGNLVVSQIRRQSPADIAGLRENDALVAINNISTLGLDRLYAVDLINESDYELELVVHRQERRKPQMMTFFLDTSAARGPVRRPETASRDIDLSWRSEPPPASEPPRFRPADPSITPISLDRLLREFEPPQANAPTTKKTSDTQSSWSNRSGQSSVDNGETEDVQTYRQQRRQNLVLRKADPSRLELPTTMIRPFDKETTPITLARLLQTSALPERDPSMTKRTFANSNYYAGANDYYPSIEEQIEMARQVAKSIGSSVNRDSRGAKMFEAQHQRAEKYVKEGPEPISDPIESASQQQLEYMIPPAPPPPPAPSAPSFPSLVSAVPPAPPPPPPPPGQPRSIQEYIEKMRLFPKTTHTEVSPQVCFDIATALHTSGSRGGAMFAKRRAKAQAWEVANEGTMGTNALSTPVPQQAERPKLVSKLEQQQQLQQQQQQHMTMIHHPARAVSPPMPEQSSLSSHRVSLTGIRKAPELMARPVAANTGAANIQAAWSRTSMDNTSAGTSGVSSQPTVESTTKPAWRPVKFNIPQRAS